MVYIENKYLNFENFFFVEIIAKKKREEKILEKKPRVVEVPRVREARVSRGSTVPLFQLFN